MCQKIDNNLPIQKDQPIVTDNPNLFWLLLVQIAQLEVYTTYFFAGQNNAAGAALWGVKKLTNKFVNLDQEL